MARPPKGNSYGARRGSTGRFNETREEHSEQPLVSSGNPRLRANRNRADRQMEGAVAGRYSRGSQRYGNFIPQQAFPPADEKGAVDDDSPVVRSNNPRENLAAARASLPPAVDLPVMDSVMVDDAGFDGSQPAGDAPLGADEAGPDLSGFSKINSVVPPQRVTHISQNLEDDPTRAAKRKRRHRIIGISVAAVLVLIVCCVGVAFAYIGNIQSNLNKNVSDETMGVLDASAPGEPFYMLLLGTDHSQERATVEQDFYGDAFRSDSMMLMRIDPGQKKIACVSLIRDTQIDLGEYGIQKLNAAYAFGGVPLTLETVSELAGVPISHYAEIDFDGFKEVVDALGGVTVDVPVDIDDDLAGGSLSAGVQTLTGEQALILCRSRHTYDDIGDGDHYRAANQRMVISAIGQKILSSDLPTMVETIETLSRYVTTDMGVLDIASLANNLRGIKMDQDFYTATMPTEAEYKNDVWWEILDQKAWNNMMNRINKGLPPVATDEVDDVTGIVMANSGGGLNGLSSSGSTSSTSSSSVTRSGFVSVKNGTDRNGIGAQAATLVSQLGYTTEASNANNSNYQKTVVIYDDPLQKRAAEEIVAQLGQGFAMQNDGSYVYDGDFLVVVGNDWL